jgi:hypothetical protein
LIHLSSSGRVFPLFKREEGKDKEGVYEGKRFELKKLLLRGLTGEKN